MDIVQLVSFQALKAKEKPFSARRQESVENKLIYRTKLVENNTAKNNKALNGTFEKLSGKC